MKKEIWDKLTDTQKVRYNQAIIHHQIKKTKISTETYFCYMYIFITGLFIYLEAYNGNNINLLLIISIFSFAGLSVYFNYNYYKEIKKFDTKMDDVVMQYIEENNKGGVK